MLVSVSFYLKTQLNPSCQNRVGFILFDVVLYDYVVEQNNPPFTSDSGLEGYPG